MSWRRVVPHVDFTGGVLRFGPVTTPSRQIWCNLTYFPAPIQRDAQLSHSIQTTYK